MIASNNSILVPIDFSDQSQVALESACKLAKLSNAKIYLLHVLKVTKSWLGIFSNDEQVEISEKIKEKLAAIGKLAKDSGDVEIIPLLKDGKLLETILETADEIDAKLIIIGTHPSSNFKQKIIGHNAYRIVKESKCPVLTIKGSPHKQNWTNIILPLDLTKETREKVNHAIFYAKLFKAKIHTVSVITSNNEDFLKKLNVQMQQVVKYISKEGVSCTWNVLKTTKDSDKIASKLIQYAKEKDADVIIIMTQQEMEISEYFIGTTAAELINNSEVPILSVIPKFRYKYLPIG